MMTEEFLLKVKNRFDTINQSTLDDIASLVKTISDYDNEVLWSKFVDTYEYNTPPKRATFKKLLFQLGIREANNSEIYFTFCKKCRIGYPTDIRYCQCGQELRITVSNDLPEHFVQMHRYCSMCAKFVEGIQGAVCRFYGHGSQDWNIPHEQKKKQLELCRSCQCRRCCYEQRVVNHDWAHYADMCAQGEFNGPTGFRNK